MQITVRVCWIDRFSQNRHVEFRIVLLYIACSVLLAKFLDDRLHGFRILDGRRPELCFRSPRIDPNRRILEDIAVPLRVGTTYWQQVELVALKHEPDRNRDGLPSLPANHAELDLPVSGKAFFQILLVRGCHSKGAYFTAASTIAKNSRFPKHDSPTAKPHPGPNYY